MGDEFFVVINVVKNGEGNFGYNVVIFEYGDMLEMGIFDFVKVMCFVFEYVVFVVG